MSRTPPSSNHRRYGPVVMTVDAIRDAWAVLMPVNCAGCERPDRALCRECSQCLVAATSVHSTPQQVPVYAAFRYEGRARQVLLAFKNHHRTTLARPLAAALVPALRRAVEQSHECTGSALPILIVGVPSSRKAFRTRGYHPVSLVLRAAAVRHARGLRITQKIYSQKSLSAEQRVMNVRGAFVATRSFAGIRVIIVDDVLTTGATIDEAARAISAAGGTVIAAATIGFTPRTLSARDNASGEDYGMEKGAT